MAYSENIAQRIRKSLEHLAHVEEKKMFGSLAFMVNRKLCLTAGPNRIMCRINPELHEQEVKRPGCSSVTMRGRNYKGYIYVQEANLILENDFKHWVKLALDFNKKLNAKE